MPNLNAAFACDQVFHLDKYLKKKAVDQRALQVYFTELKSASMVGCYPGSVSSNWLSILRINGYFDSMDMQA